jgi:hypothetical protein
MSGGAAERAADTSSSVCSRVRRLLFPHSHARRAPPPLPSGEVDLALVRQARSRQNQLTSAQTCSLSGGSS